MLIWHLREQLVGLELFSFSLYLDVLILFISLINTLVSGLSQNKSWSSFTLGPDLARQTVQSVQATAFQNRHKIIMLDKNISFYSRIRPLRCLSRKGFGPLINIVYPCIREKTGVWHPKLLWNAMKMNIFFNLYFLSFYL